MPDLLTGAPALALLREVVGERPDHVYVNTVGGDEDMACRYVHGDEPGCLIGTVLYRHGIPLADLHLHEGSSVHSLPSVWLDVDANELLQAAQNLQDRGTTWAEALAAAEDVVAVNSLT